MKRVHDWANGAPRYRANDRKGSRVPDDVTETVTMVLSNTPGSIKMYIANAGNGQVLDFPDDGMLFLFVNKDVAQEMRDDLLNPSEFPDEV